MLPAFRSLLLLAGLWAGSTAEAAETRVHNLGWAFTNVYALDGGDQGVLLVDAHNPGQEDKILKALAKTGIEEDRVSGILLTHAHPDHAGSAGALAAHLDVPVIIGAADQAALERGTPDELVATGGRGKIVALAVHKGFDPTSPGELHAVEDSMDLAPYGVSGEARVVGGHTRGSLVVVLDDGQALTGDLIRGHMVRTGRPTLHFFHRDTARAHDTLRALCADPSIEALYPGHGGVLEPQEVQDWLEDRAPRHEARIARQASSD